MALKALMLRRSIENKKAALSQLRAKNADFQRREQELEQSIAEAVTAEDEAAVSAEIETFESERTTHNTAVADVEAEITQLEQELAAEETAQPAPVPTAPRTPTTEQERNDNHMNTRTFYGMTHQERDAFFARQEVKDLLANVRSAIREKRAVSNAGLLIPEIVLPLIRQATEENSKLLRRVSQPDLEPSANYSRPSSPIRTTIPGPRCRPLSLSGQRTALIVFSLTTRPASLP